MCWHLPLLLLPLLELDANTDCDNQPNAPCSVLCLLSGRLPLYQKSILQLAIELHECATWMCMQTTTLVPPADWQSCRAMQCLAALLTACCDLECRLVVQSWVRCLEALHLLADPVMVGTGGTTATHTLARHRRACRQAVSARSRGARHIGARETDE